MSQQVAHWMFTWYKPDAMPNWNPDKMRYMIYQAEQCPTTGKKHFQGYVEFHRSQKLGAAKKALGDPKLHLDVRQGSRAQARDYCMKEDTRMPEGGPFEFGEWIEGSQGKRTDLDEVSVKIKAGKSFKEIATEHTNTAIRYHKGIKVVSKVLNVKTRSREVENVILWGDTECGKSTYVWNKYGSDIYSGYIVGWWENYDGQEVAFYDEFNGKEHMDSSLFKKICDVFPVVVPCKGDSVAYLARINLFSSNVNPRDWYDRVHWDAIRRRMTHIVHCQKFNGERIYNCELCPDNCSVVDDLNKLTF